MNIHEYQAKELLAKFGVAVPAGHAAMSVEEAVAAAGTLPGPMYVVKSQIHAGGRGKGKFKELGPDAKGGVRLTKSMDEVKRRGDRHARQHAGHDPDRRRRQAGQPPLRHRRRRHRQGILPVDAGRSRHSGRIAMVVSTEGGMDIETVAHDSPEKIQTITIDPAEGFHGRTTAAPSPSGSS